MFYINFVLVFKVLYFIYNFRDYLGGNDARNEYLEENIFKRRNRRAFDGKYTKQSSREYKEVKTGTKNFNGKFFRSSI